VIRELQVRGYVCGIISDSYHSIANHVKNLLGLDFTLGNELEFRKSVATGEVKIPSQLLKDRFSQCEHDHCKSNFFQYILHRFGISLADSVAVGDGENDIVWSKWRGRVSPSILPPRLSTRSPTMFFAGIRLNQYWKLSDKAAFGVPGKPAIPAYYWPSARQSPTVVVAGPPAVA
jgi:haloacid dehalogenase-like hydrolase